MRTDAKLMRGLGVGIVTLFLADDDGDSLDNSGPGGGGNEGPNDDNSGPGGGNNEDNSGPGSGDDDSSGPGGGG